MSVLSNPITANGEYTVELKATGNHYMNAAGDFDSGTLVCSIGALVADGGSLIPEFGSLTADVSAPQQVFLPSGTIYIKLTGATAPSIVVSISPENL